jgi:small GTP-binding protein
LAVLGEGGSGKSTLIARLVTGEFLDKSMTVGFDVETWTVQESDAGCIKLVMFDFGGQKQFRFFQGSLIMGAKAALLVFDCCSYHSMIRIHDWLGMLEAIPDEHKILVGTKIDVGGSISDEEISSFAKELNLAYVTVSSKTGQNFDVLIEKLHNILISLD